MKVMQGPVDGISVNNRYDSIGDSIGDPNDELDDDPGDDPDDEPNSGPISCLNDDYGEQWGIELLASQGIISSD